MIPHAILIASALASLLWLPTSVWLLLRSRKLRRAQTEALTALHAQLGINLFRSARRDPLTGLPTRQAFLETMAACLARGAPAALLVIDVDRFLTVNTNYGDTVGDELLRALAGRLHTLAGAHGHLARLDGDEFAMLLDQPDQLADVPGAADRILHALTAPFPAAGQLIDLSPSIGLACAPAHGDTAEGLLRAAGLALAQAKARGGRAWLGCGADLTRALESRAHIRGQLSRAIAEGQIVPWYQPTVRLPDGSLDKFEVLARWMHPELGILTPEQFIPIADEMGLSGQISMALLRQVALDCADWPATYRFAINVSAGQVRELIGFFNAQPGEWQRRMDLSRLDVEITEAALLHDRAMTRELIDTLHEHGARAGLDNFGSGFSNFSFLRDMPFDSIKIGQAFIQTMVQDKRAEACVLAMLWLGHGLGIDMVAAGVEDAATAERLAELGCTLAQGFYYARPVPADGVLHVLGAPTCVAIAA